MPAATLFPEIEPFAHGLLDVGGGHRVYWEACGNPEGRPALVLHGGPGSGCSPSARRYFDPARYRVILLDQRGCGRSLPHAADPATDLAANTTWHLVDDLERLRRHLEIGRWLLFGTSWGSTLALAYAERHPGQVAALVLAGVTTTRRSEIDWLYRGLAPLFPEQWARFRAGVPAPGRDGDLVAAYWRLLQDPDPAVRARAAENWHAWEAAPLSVRPDARYPARWLDPAYRMARARIITHYFHHGAWFEEGGLLREAHRLAGIPGVLVQGRLDLEAPLTTAWELAQAWPGSELVVVPDAGHSPAEPGMAGAILAATARFADRAF
ncbi:prolyl aminopeptidase [Geminicoccus roseus]|uniref:prolyl aminopeptidase n=1 Tax=Geminicoccus roseus TaxID=404900 RepID=UPI00040EDF1A|nr:prolyl aminopeptidase [Geminicoccus roseus]